MKTNPIPLLGAALLLLAPAALPAEETADSLWAKVESSMQGVRNPTPRPTSRDQAIQAYREGLKAFDAAETAFLQKAPDDSRRWKARLFEVQTARLRQIVALPAKGDQAATIREILKGDADAEIKSEASALQVLDAAEAIERGSGDLKEWTKLAEAHLQTFPDNKLNGRIKSKMASLQAIADVKTKPLDIKFTALDGREVDLAKMRGKVVLIDFWAVWCGPCVAELPNVLKAYEKLHPKGFEIIGISLDSDKARLEKFVKDKNMPWPQYFDGKSWKNEISSRFGINAIPAMWLVDKKGMVVSTNVRGRLEEEVEKRLAE